MDQVGREKGSYYLCKSIVPVPSFRLHRPQATPRVGTMPLKSKSGDILRLAFVNTTITLGSYREESDGSRDTATMGKREATGC